MSRYASLFGAIFIGTFTAVCASAQSLELQQGITQGPKISTAEAVTRIMESSSLTYHGAPFHARLVIDQPGHPDSQFQGAVEIYWANSTRYRVTVTSKPF